jgi:putative transposase
MMPDWPHSPVHRLSEAGAYMVTAATYRRTAIFADERRRDYVRDTLFECAAEFGWDLQAWAVIPNHYHFIAVPRGEPETLHALVRRLHSLTARRVNAADGVRRRRVWFQYWDTHLTYPKSYLARLRYVHENPVRHGLALDATRYPWCSAAWFERSADTAFYRVVRSMPIDRINATEVDYVAAQQ